MRHNNGSKWFQLLLILIGFIFGIFGSYLLYFFQQQNLENNTVALIYSIASEQLDENTSTLELITTVLKIKDPKGKAKATTISSLAWAHDITILEAFHDKLNLINLEVAHHFYTYYLLTKQCKNEIDFLSKTHEKHEYIR